MIDRAKVIKRLECEIARKDLADSEWLDCVEVKLLQDTLTLLKAQEPIRPGIGIIHNEDGSKSYFIHCPFDGTPLDEGDNYCRKCGRAVKLDD